MQNEAEVLEKADMNPTSEQAQAQPGMVALFVSDLHLQESMPRTTQAFIDFLHLEAARARQLYLLGDMFEYWAGDDDIDSPGNRTVIDAIKAVSDAGVKIFWIAGNRDFLAGSAFAQAAGLTQLPDPYVAGIAGNRIVLTHGDAQCTDDLSYMAFRAQVRTTEWQQTFLAMPLAQRKEIIEGMRKGSRAAQQTKSYEIMDVNPSAIEGLFESSGASIMIHGHTHRPATHTTRSGNTPRTRYVLPDWDCDITPARGGWLGIDVNGRYLRFGMDGAALPA